jgi:hypothetical protein
VCVHQSRTGTSSHTSSCVHGDLPLALCSATHVKKDYLIFWPYMPKSESAGCVLDMGRHRSGCEFEAYQPGGHRMQS